MLILYRCPQCESLYCGPAACRFTGLKNNGRAGEALAGMNARRGAMCNGQRSRDQLREAPTPAAHHHAAPQAVVGQTTAMADEPGNPEPGPAVAALDLREAMTKLKKEMEDILKGETDAAGRPQEF